MYFFLVSAQFSLSHRHKSESFAFAPCLQFQNGDDLRIDPNQPLVVGDELFRERLRGEALEGADSCPVGADLPQELPERGLKRVHRVLPV